MKNNIIKEKLMKTKKLINKKRHIKSKNKWKDREQ